MSTLETLATWLTGEFENSTQAAAQPVWFVRLRLWQRPLPQGLYGRLAFFAEQANVLNCDRPYRQRIFTLAPAGDSQTITVQYYACQQPERWRGAGALRQRLQAIGPSDLEELPGCILQGTWHGDRFEAKPPANCQCFFSYQGERRQVILGFVARPDGFVSFDKGVDPASGRGLWGALMGPYEFVRLA